jgi:hypothetical protein
MNARQRKILGIALFITFAVGVLVSIIIGVATHTENGFADEDNVWDHVPLTVACRGHVPSEDDACDAAADVTRTINTRLGFDMLEWTSSPGSADIDIVMRAPVEVGGDDRDAAGGHFELRGRANVYERCEVWTMNVSGPDDLEWLTLYHEIGCHCLGLEHDDVGAESNNICRPVQTASPGIPPWISDSDRRLLRERYRR